MHIKLLDVETINKIAAGEVVEGPASIVKELVENSIDAKSGMITVEIKEGGTEFIRITDNGCGIEREDIELAFTSHATSKIEDVLDLFSIMSLGFRGEALASIAAVSRVELITKTASGIVGTRAVYEGGRMISIEDIGAPSGTTIIVRDLFFNTPARRKFLKSKASEGGKVGNIVEELSFSHPEIAFRFISDGQNKLTTYGNDNVRENIYAVYGKEYASNLIEVCGGNEYVKISGFIGKPIINRGSRACMNYFVNHRYIKAEVIRTAIEAAYSGFVMQHRYPFTMLYLDVDPRIIDINIHPRKMELKFQTDIDVWQLIYDICLQALSNSNLIWRENTSRDEKPKAVVEQKQVVPQPVIESKPVVESKPVIESKPVASIQTEVPKASEAPEVPEVPEAPVVPEASYVQSLSAPLDVRIESFETKRSSQYTRYVATKEDISDDEIKEQLSLFEKKDKNEINPDDIHIVGQVFKTYWIMEWNDNMYMIDQHAAHEKVYYERFVRRFNDNEVYSQQLLIPLVLPLNINQANTLREHMELFTKLGFEFSEFGNNEFALHGVPLELCGVDEVEFFIEIIDKMTMYEGRNLSQAEIYKPVCEKIATMACKAAIKGNMAITEDEFKALIVEMFKLENPYNCPHGRPTTISMSKYEIEKKFKRIV